MYKKVVLNNGVRIVLERMSAIKSVAMGIWAHVGSRYEVHGQEGFSHFAEHMMFKGTRRRTASQISHEIDALGGEMNAFTTHEATSFYAKVLDQGAVPALDLLTDLFHCSRFMPKEIEKEKQVILEEIRTTKDDPEDYIHELHAKDVLGNHPIGKSILGEPRHLRGLRRKDLIRFIQTHYRPEKTVIAVAGQFHAQKMIDLLQHHFGTWAKPQSPSEPANVVSWPSHIAGGRFLHVKKLEQVHVCLGFKGLPIGHPDRYVANVLNTILGGGVSSRLFQDVREKRGLAYTIYSHLSGFSDGGLLTVYVATKPAEVKGVIEIVSREIRKLCTHSVQTKELERTKTQLKGNLMLGLEGTYGRMAKLAKDELYQGRHISLREMVKEIDRVSVDRIQALSRRLFDFDSLTVSVLGRVDPKMVSV